MGQLRTTTLQTPPIESSSARAALTMSVIFSACGIFFFHFFRLVSARSLDNVSHFFRLRNKNFSRVCSPVHLLIVVYRVLFFYWEFVPSPGTGIVSCAGPPVCVCVHVCVCACDYVWMCVYVCVYVHTRHHAQLVCVCVCAGSTNSRTLTPILVFFFVFIFTLKSMCLFTFIKISSVYGYVLRHPDYLLAGGCMVVNFLDFFLFFYFFNLLAGDCIEVNFLVRQHQVAHCRHPKQKH